ncbi:MAG: hypothetical protein HOQ10_10500 [Frateuria sp.]|uniref:hypothetical protein n=1 Tax=Frateuria sp. TaxID=2211372 RepID=UPI0017BB2A50|nr:hypothetical protein [Frateuria sp.]NUO73133.1 hypothetical protein [Frateuria sp.]NUR22649.1 hypothetical protein [Frateuria sp.]
MRPKLAPSILLASLLVLPAWAQTSGKPLNLKLPPSDLPAAASTAPKPASAPGVYYGDTSGHTAADDEAATPDCDDATYNQPQVHGSVGMGVMSGNHVDGSYQRGTVNLSKAFGSCGHPGGGVSLSIGAGSGHFHGRGH